MDRDSRADGLDVPEHAEQEKTDLHARTEHRASLIRFISDILLLLDIDGRVIDFNDSALEEYGYTSEEMSRLTLRDLRAPGTQPPLADGLNLVAAGKGTLHETWHQRKDGSRFPVEVSARLLEVGGKKFVQGVLRNISERRQAEERVHLLASALEAAANAIVITDRTGRIVWTNAAITALTGHTADSLQGQSTRTFSSGVHPAAFFETMWSSILRGETWRGEIVNRRKSGELYTEAMTITSVRDSMGEIAHFVAIKEDVSERRRADDSLRESEERYRDLFENANDIIYTHDRNGNFTSLNRTGELLSGYSREECLAMNISQVIAPEHLEASTAIVTRALSGGEVRAFPSVFLTKDGRRIAIEVSSRAILRDGKPGGVQGIARDVSDRAALEEQLRQSQKMEAVGRLAGGVAHDFNNLLGVILGYGELVLDEMSHEDPRRHKIDEILKAGQRAAALTRQLLAFSRRQVMEPKVLDLDAVVGNTENLLRRLIGEDIDLVTVRDPSLGQVRADPGQVEQILMNLAVNARDAMPRGGKLTIETRNVEWDPLYVGSHQGAQPGRFVMLSVTDDGTGMDTDTRSHIFEPFFTTKPEGEGTGLGLATVYGIVKQSGGYVWVYSEPDRGTTFKVFLPRIDGAVGPSLVEASEAAPFGGSESILIVEDAEALRGVMRESLLASGYHVHEAGNGADALRLLEEIGHDLDLLVTDIVMPGMGGKELAQAVTQRYREVKVLFVSGYPGEAMSHQGALDPGVSFLEKPFRPAELARKVRQVLEGGARH